MALALVPNSHLSRDPHDILHHQVPQLRSVAMDQPSSSRPSLPSISSLIEAVNDQTESANGGSPKYDPNRRISGGSQGHGPASPDRPSIKESPRSHPPATPELPPTSSFDFPRQTDGSYSPTASNRTSHYSQGGSTTNPEFYAQRTSSYPPIPELNSSYPPMQEMSNWSATSHPRSPSTSTSQDRTRSATDSYSEPTPDAGNYPGLPQQRPLPANFPPPLQAAGVTPIDPQMAPAWQHHHYYPPTNPPGYPQTQERYICPTCNKPFSRPSSLKIHTYSHTGEKPYKCKHEGCGKYFSVRSNMKRHEKGCHGGENASASGGSPKPS